MTPMTVEEKHLDILQSVFGSISLRMRSGELRAMPHVGLEQRWYASFDRLVEQKGDGVLIGVRGDGASPLGAVEELWRVATDSTLVTSQDGVRIEFTWKDGAFAPKVCAQA